MADLSLASSSSAGELVFIVIVAIVAGIVNLVKWIRRKQAEKEIAERRLRRDEAEGEAQKPRRMGGLEELLRALEAASEEQGEPGADEEWEVTADASPFGADSTREVLLDTGGPAVHEVESRVWDVDAEVREQGLGTVDPDTLEQERRREREKRRAAGLAAAAAKLAEKERAAQHATEEARRAASTARAPARSPEYADRVLVEEAEARAREIAAAVEGGPAAHAAAALGWLGGPATALGRGASGRDVRSGMVWSFILGAPRALAPYGEDETGSVPGLRR